MTAKNPAPQVVSLDERARQRRDALPEPTPFELFGVSFTLPPIKSLPMDVQERIAGNDIEMFRITVGKEKVEEMIAAGFQVSDIELIIEEWQERSGVKPGESSASPTS